MKPLIYLLLPLFLSWYAGAQRGPFKAVIVVTDTIPKDSLIAITADSLRVADSLPTVDSLQITGRFVSGTASFYSRKFEGRKTATGDIFHHNKYTAASNNFKLNTWVRVTNTRNNKSVIVRINDRMHPRMKKKGRVIDLTREAAGKLGFLSKGLAKVKVEVLQKNLSK